MSISPSHQRFAVASEFEVDLAADLAARPPSGNLSNPATVRWLQAALNVVLPASLAEDGAMGPQTRAAVSRFQAERGLTVDGIAGPQTFGALVNALDALASRGSDGGGIVPGPAACAFLREPEVLDDFDFDQVVLKPEHLERLEQIGACLAGSPDLRRIRIVGHTDPEGATAYNDGLGRRRADSVRSALQAALARSRPGLDRAITIDVETRGEREPISAIPARNRRVQVFLNRRTVAPPETGTCSAPDSSTLREFALALELDAAAAKPKVTTAVGVRARLAFFQNAENSSHRNHFLCGASTQAARMSAIAEPVVSDCRRRVGATPYDTGADIIAAIAAAQQCLEQAVDTVHIFSHSGSNGVYGRTGIAGLYEASATYPDRVHGGRTVADLSTTFFSNDVTFVLHGCNNAAGTDNVARSLFDHLAASLTSPRVYGHYNSGCASRNNSWREYSNANPMGRKLGVIPVYASMSCCG